MKKLIALASIALLALSTSAFGFGDFEASQYQNQLSVNKNYNSATGVGIAGAYSDGSDSSSDNSVTFNESDRVEYDGTFRVKNTPNLGSIPLTTSTASFNNGTCNGSAGIQATIAGTGVGGSTTTVDEPCNLRYLAALAANLGTKADGLRVACLEPDMKLANPSLCNRVYDAAQLVTTAGTKVDLTYRPKNDFASTSNAPGFF